MVVTPMNNANFHKEIQNFFKNYHDRGMQKWGGFFLSDHTVQINKDTQKANTTYKKETEMDLQEISRTLLKAFSNHYKIRLQLKNRNYNNEFRKDITGFVNGYHNSQIIISGYAVEIEDINHVDILRPNKNGI